MKIFTSLAVALIAATTLGVTTIQASPVTAEGRTAGDSTSAREQALTDALREAVRLGAGVNIASQSQASNFALDYDRVFAAAFGYVKSYKVIESGMGKDGISRAHRALPWTFRRISRVFHPTLAMPKHGSRRRPRISSLILWILGWLVMRS